MGTGAATPPEPPGRQSAKLNIEKLGRRKPPIIYIECDVFSCFYQACGELPIQAGRPSATFGRAVRSVAIVKSRQREDKTIIDFVDDH
jgi:hypothetical protein